MWEKQNPTAQIAERDYFRDLINLRNVVFFFFSYIASSYVRGNIISHERTEILMRSFGCEVARCDTCTVIHLKACEFEITMLIHHSTGYVLYS